MADGSLKFDTKIDINGFSEGISSLEKAMNRLTNVIEQLSAKMTSGLQGTVGEAAESVTAVDRIVETEEEAMRRLEAIPITGIGHETATEMEQVQASVEETAEAVGQSTASFADHQTEIEQFMTLEAEAATHTNEFRTEIARLSAELKELDARGLYFGDEEYDEAYKKLAIVKQALADYKAELLNPVPTVEVPVKVDVDSLEGQLIAAKERLKELANQGLTFGNAEFDQAYVDVERAGRALADYRKSLIPATVEQEKFNKSARKMPGEMKRTEAAAIPLTKSILKLGNMFKLMLIRMAMRTVISGAQEGLRNLAQYSDETNQTLSELNSEMTQAKNGFATAFSPISTMALPLLTKLTDMLITASSAVSSFFAVLSGKSTYTKAVKVQEDYAASLKKSASSASDLNRQLYSFDKLSKAGDDSSGVGSKSSGVDPSQMFTEMEVSTDMLDFVAGLEEMLGPTTDALIRLWVALQPLGQTIGSGLEWFYFNVLVPLASWTFGEAIPKFLDVLGTGAGTLNELLLALQPGWKWFWDNILAPAAEIAGVFIIQALEWLNEKLLGLSDWIADHREEISQFGAIMLVVGSAFLFVHGGMSLVTKILPLIQTLMGGLASFITSPLGIIAALMAIVVWAGNGEEMLENLKLVLSGLLDFITGVFTGDWDRAWNGIKDIFKGVFNGIIIILESAANLIVKGINSLSFDVPDWVPGIGGRHVGFDLSPVRLPRLSTGTVVPPRAGEFAAILGDNNREAEIVSPVSTMKQAFKEALAEMGGLGGGDINIEFTGSLAALGRLLEPVIRREQVRKGPNLVTGGNE